MNEIESLQVYGNLVKLMEYRGATLTTPAMTDATFVEKINHYNYVAINGTRGENDPRGKALILIVLIAPTNEKNDYATKSGNFKKLFKLAPKLGPNDNLEMMFVSESPLTSHIQKHLAQFKIENPKISVEDHTYDIFMIEAPKHELVPSHRIATKEEVDAFCLWFYVSPENFPKISASTDTQAIWLGAKPGMVLAIERASENAGPFPVYRYVTKN